MVEKCCGLPLAIVVLGGLLSFQVKKFPGKTLQTVWDGENKSSSWLSNRGNDSYKCSGIVALSYDYLPYYLKPCFLYTSLLFPSATEEIRARKLFQCWIAEGFIQGTDGQTLEDTAGHYLEELASRNLIQVKKKRCDGRVSTCSIHGILQGISVSESTTDEFSKTYDRVEEFNRTQNSRRRVAIGKKESQNKHYLSVSHPRIRSLLPELGENHAERD